MFSLPCTTIRELQSGNCSSHPHRPYPRLAHTCSQHLALTGVPLVPIAPPSRGSPLTLRRLFFFFLLSIKSFIFFSVRFYVLIFKGPLTKSLLHLDQALCRKPGPLRGSPSQPDCLHSCRMHLMEWPQLASCISNLYWFRLGQENSSSKMHD